jgi:hypothetical protein
MPKPTWPQTLRAEGALTAYTTVQDWLARLDIGTIQDKLQQKINEKREIVYAYNKKVPGGES